MAAQKPQKCEIEFQKACIVIFSYYRNNPPRRISEKERTNALSIFEKWRNSKCRRGEISKSLITCLVKNKKDSLGTEHKSNLAYFIPKEELIKIVPFKPLKPAAQDLQP